MPASASAKATPAAPARASKRVPAVAPKRAAKRTATGSATRAPTAARAPALPAAARTSVALTPVKAATRRGKPPQARPAGPAQGPDPTARLHARLAGLRWVNDTQPGLSRRRRGEVFSYRDADAKPVRDKSVLERIRKLAIPPAWRDVWICPLANGHLQATGRDARGRKQYRYHADWAQARGQTKFAHLQEFGRALPAIRARVRRQLAGPATPTRDRVLATLVHLLDTTWMRIGNPQYARENGSYGLSTLRNRHLALQGHEVRLSFTGKSGVRHEVRLADPRVAKVVRRCRELPGQELFQWVGEDGQAHAVASDDVNAWLAQAAQGACVTAKDFRTWHGSVQALQMLLDACARQTACRPQEVVAAVAKCLGNTPAVCRKAYIHPCVLAMADDLASVIARGEAAGTGGAPTPPPRRGLKATERRLLSLLGDAA